MADVPQYKTITVSPETPAVGATIGNVDLTQDLPDATIREIHAALMAHGVVFFRDQDIDARQQADFARRFGRLRMARRAAFLVDEKVPEMHVLENDEARPPNVNHYHSDGIFRRAPEFASILRGVVVPPAGGDTIWVGMKAAYDALSADMKAYLEDKVAWHDFQKLHGSAMKKRSWEGDNFERMESMRRDNPPVSHPLIRRHPVTGQPSLYLSESFTTHVEGLSTLESKGLLDFLFAHCRLPEFQCRFHWRVNSVAMWDNRATLHYAVADYWPLTRIMNRVTVESDALGSGEAWPENRAA
jgi:taurine dioxygenase